ncbi:MAG: trypsin-like peptidase domain-containing protein [Chrysiogenetes bacterium]|nr:trypsin-like peptidase domain-containing protein [Chrysiogenetes bacterium]
MPRRPVFLALLLLILSMPVRAGATEPTNPADPRITPVVRAVEKISPAVVNIRTLQEIRDNPFEIFGLHRFFAAPTMPQRREVRSLGTGVLIDPVGYVLTNAHVILGGNQVLVALADGTEIEAEVIGADQRRDLAVLRLPDNRKYPAVPLGDSRDVRIGETVIAIGNPFGLSHTVTTGVLSAVGRVVQAEGNSFENFLQTDAAINPGNSGGPLANVLGQVIGINTAIDGRAQGIGFAIPINDARRVLDDLIRYGQVQEPWVGFQVQELDLTLAQAFGAEEKGLLVTFVSKASPAAHAGLQIEDVLLDFDGHPMRSYGDFRARMKNLTVNDKVQLTILRDRQLMRLSLTTTALPSSEVEELLWKRIGIRTVSNDEKLRRRYKLVPEIGAVIAEVARRSIAGQIGLQPGDVIVRVDSRKTADQEGFLEALRNSLNHETLLLAVVRGRYQYLVTIPLE